MEEVARKYPYADLKQVRELWERYQYVDQKSYRSFLDYYERHYKWATP